MSSLAEEFVTLDKDNHVRMKGAIETAMSADFKVEEAPKHDSTVVFSNFLTFFPSSIPKVPIEAHFTLHKFNICK